MRDRDFLQSSRLFGNVRLDTMTLMRAATVECDRSKLTGRTNCHYYYMFAITCRNE